jgi:hypothetical protein
LYLEVRELPAGKQVGTIAVHHFTWLTFSPDGEQLLFDGLDTTATLSVLEVPSLKLLWKRDRPFNDDVPFSADGHTAFVRWNEPPEVQGLDCATGELRARIAVKSDDPVFTAPGNRTRRFLLLHQSWWKGWDVAPQPIWQRCMQWLPWLNRRDMPTDAVVVFDTESYRERFRLQGWNVYRAILSDDGRMLATQHDDDERREIRCWDVDAFKPLRWVIGVPAGLAALLVLLATWRGRQRAHCKKAPESGSTS